MHTRPEPSAPQGVEVRQCTPDEFDAWVDVVVEGFAHPDGKGLPSHEEFPRDIVHRAMLDFVTVGATAYIANCEGVAAGGTSVRLTDRLAQLSGRGYGFGISAPRRAVSAVDGPVQRNGFQLRYTRAIMVNGAYAIIPLLWSTSRTKSQ